MTHSLRQGKDTMSLEISIPMAAGLKRASSPSSHSQLFGTGLAETTSTFEDLSRRESTSQMRPTLLISQIPRYAHVPLWPMDERVAAANIEKAAPGAIRLSSLWMAIVPSAVDIQDGDESLESKSIDQIDG